MKLSVSNIAWNEDEDEAVLTLLSSLGAKGIEIAPTKLWPDWEGASAEAAQKAAAALKARGFAVPALQAILFGKPDLKVFGSEKSQTELLDHIEHVAAIAQGFDAAVLVFGSPKNRDPGDLGEEEAYRRGADFFHRAGERCKPYSVELCLEPNPKHYACNFMTSWRDVVRMAKAVNHPNIGIHLDVACIALEGDDPVEAVEACAGDICHYHATEPELGDFENAQMPHDKIGAALRAQNYDNWISIEMRRSENPLKSIETAVKKVLNAYG